MKKRSFLLSLILIIMIITISTIPTALAAASDKGVYVIPIEGDIGPSMESFVSNQLKKAEDMNIGIVILDIDTLGGKVDSALNIKEIIKSYNSKFKFYTFINNKAESAGVMLALLGDKMYITSDGTIGSASILPYDEKTNSAWSSMLKAQAEAKGKPGEIAKATADYNVEIKGVKEKGTLLNMTAKDAVKLGFADGEAKDIGEVAKKIEYRGDKIITGEKDFKVVLSGIISNPYISSLLILIGIIALIAEIFVPSFGILGTLGATSIGTYFLGNVFAGHTSWWAVGLFALGVALAIIEMHIPGFGIAGVSGVILMSISIVMSAETVKMGLVIMILSWILVGVGIFLVIKFGLTKGPFAKMILKSNLGEKEYLAYDSKSFESLIGKEGISSSMLRPSGTVIIDDEVLHVQTRGDFVKSNTPIKVIQIEGNKIIVKKVD